MTIVDDDLIEYDEYHYFSFYGLNDSSLIHDTIEIIIRDDEEDEGKKL